MEDVVGEDLILSSELMTTDLVLLLCDPLEFL